MTTVRGLILSLLLALSLPSPADASDRFPVIVQLQTRELRVAVHSSPDGPLFTLRRLDGAVIGYQLPEPTLAARFPAVHEYLRSALAGGGSDAVLLWAGQ